MNVRKASESVTSDHGNTRRMEEEFTNNVTSDYCVVKDVGIGH